MNKFPLIISAIAAMGENRVIGKQNQLPWRLPADLRHFKTITTGHPILMGRKTYESIGKPLPNRTNIILTRNASFKAAGCILATSIENAIQTTLAMGSAHIFIIGGAEIYEQSLPYLQRIHLTLVHQTFDGDAYFPLINPREWQETSRETHSADESNEYDYSFIELKRR